jgi:hypothetical protein
MYLLIDRDVAALDGRVRPGDHGRHRLGSAGDVGPRRASVTWVHAGLIIIAISQGMFA